MKSVNKYYHIIESLDIWLSIKKEGLKSSDEGYIYLLTNKDVAWHVAPYQLGYMESYGLLEINPGGITSPIEDDNVAEVTAKYQVRVKQNIINPKFVKYINMYWVNPAVMANWVESLLAK